ncbi:MAG: MoxR family ATPase, partial [Elusimicrobia bacterium]|nr:MoxR family ATPase [Elusimicrobiota bacterium]
GTKSVAALALGARSQSIASVMPKAPVSGLAAASAHTAGVQLENAMTGARAQATAASETPAKGFWRSLVPSGLLPAARSAAPAAEPEAKPQRPAEASAELQAKVEEKSELIKRIRAEVGRVIIGQEEMISALIISLMAGEHVLLEGVPGVGKTATVRAASDATEASFQRIQGTPDKLPSDILGAEILQEDPATGIKVLKLVQGPIVTHILLVDEINRMMPKTQAALLEAMQERRITIGRETIKLPEPFIVLATQNPIEQEGTYRLPEAQQDRFMMKVIVSRPSVAQQAIINRLYSSRAKSPQAEKVATLEEFVEAGKIAQQVHVSDEINNWIAHLVEATNDPQAYGLDLKKAIENGASPRAGIFLYKAAQVHAFLEGRSWVERSDVFAMAPAILRHRLMLSYEAIGQKITVEQVIEQVLKSSQVWQVAQTAK